MSTDYHSRSFAEGCPSTMALDGEHHFDRQGRCQLCGHGPEDSDFYDDPLDDVGFPWEYAIWTAFIISVLLMAFGPVIWDFISTGR